MHPLNASCRVVFLSLLVGILAASDGYPRDERIDVEHYRFEIDLREGPQSIQGRATVRVAVLRDGLRDLQLDFAGPGENGAGMRVEAVEMEGRDLRREHTQGRLRVFLPESVDAGRTLTLSIAYRGRPADGLLIERNKHGEWTYFADNWPDRARHWIPVVDHPSDKALCEFLVTAPDGMQVVSNGRLIEETDLEGGFRLTHWRSLAPLPTKVMVFGAARFAVRHLVAPDGLAVQSWAYPQDRQAAFHDFALAVPIVGFFQRRIGPFPFAKLANVQSKTRYGGMENAGSIFYGEDRITGDRSNEGLIAHEIAHQWFGDSVSEADWGHLWISEGFATYLTHLYMESAYGEGRLREGMRAARERVLDYAASNPESALVQPGVGDPASLLNPNSYQKGAWVLHLLRRRLGDALLWQGLARFYERYRDKNALTGDFRRVMEEVSGRELEWFFRQWALRPGIPEIEARWHWDAASKSLGIDIAQAGGKDPFRLLLEWEAELEDGGLRRFRFEARQASQSWKLPLPGPPRRLVLDPDVWLLARAEVIRRGE